MQNNKYWEDRANQRMADYHKNNDLTTAKINAAYDKAISDINSDINNIVYNFKLKGDLSSKEVKQLLNSKIPNPILKIVNRVIPRIKNEEIKQYLLSLVNAKAYKARITRLEALKNSIYIRSKQIADTELTESNLGYINTIKDAYYKNIYDIQKGIGIGFDFASMPVSKIDEILSNKWSGENYSQRIWSNTDVLAGKLEEIITSGLMSGKSMAKIAKELTDMSDYGKMAAERLVRTETTYVANMAELESYKECDIKKYVFVATLDMRTSQICREHDGKIYEVSKGVSGENLPPLHPWCRSTTIAYMGAKWLKGIQRRARDPQTGKTYVLPQNMNYNEWYQKYVVGKYGDQKAEAFEKIIKNKASDKKQLAKYKEVLGKEVPKPFDKFQNLKYNNAKEWDKLKEKFEPTFLKKDFKDIPSFHQNSSTLLTRKWYKAHDENIPNLIDKTKSIDQQARQAHGLRNQYRTQARDLMKDQEKRKELDIKFPNLTFEQLLEHKKLKYGLSNEEAYKDILRSSQTTNKKYDKIAGIKEE